VLLRAPDGEEDDFGRRVADVGPRRVSEVHAHRLRTVSCMGTQNL
jgi:hypothetical protein